MFFKRNEWSSMRLVLFAILVGHHPNEVIEFY